MRQNKHNNYNNSYKQQGNNFQNQNYQHPKKQFQKKGFNKKQHQQQQQQPSYYHQNAQQQPYQQQQYQDQYNYQEDYQQYQEYQDYQDPNLQQQYIPQSNNYHQNGPIQNNNNNQFYQQNNAIPQQQVPPPPPPPPPVQEQYQQPVDFLQQIPETDLLPIENTIPQQPYVNEFIPTNTDQQIPPPPPPSSQYLQQPIPQHQNQIQPQQQNPSLIEPQMQPLNLLETQPQQQNLLDHQPPNNIPEPQHQPLQIKHEPQHQPLQIKHEPQSQSHPQPIQIKHEPQPLQNIHEPLPQPQQLPAKQQQTVQQSKSKLRTNIPIKKEDSQEQQNLQPEPQPQYLNPEPQPIEYKEVSQYQQENKVELYQNSEKLDEMQKEKNLKLLESENQTIEISKNIRDVMKSFFSENGLKLNMFVPKRNQKQEIFSLHKQYKSLHNYGPICLHHCYEEGSSGYSSPCLSAIDSDNSDNQDNDNNNKGQFTPNLNENDNKQEGKSSVVKQQVVKQESFPTIYDVENHMYDTYNYKFEKTIEDFTAQEQKNLSPCLIIHKVHNPFEVKKMLMNRQKKHKAKIIGDYNIAILHSSDHSIRLEFESFECAKKLYEFLHSQKKMQSKFWEDLGQNIELEFQYNKIIHQEAFKKENFPIILRNIPGFYDIEQIKEFFLNNSVKLKDIVPQYIVKPQIIKHWYCAILVFENLEQAETIIKKLNKTKPFIVNEERSKMQLKAHLHPFCCRKRSKPRESVYKRFLMLREKPQAQQNSVTWRFDYEYLQESNNNLTVLGKDLEKLEENIQIERRKPLSQQQYLHEQSQYQQTYYDNNDNNNQYYGVYPQDQQQQQQYYYEQQQYGQQQQQSYGYAQEGQKENILAVNSERLKFQKEISVDKIENQDDNTELQGEKGQITKENEEKEEKIIPRTDIDHIPSIFQNREHKSGLRVTEEALPQDPSKTKKLKLNLLENPEKTGKKGGGLRTLQSPTEQQQQNLNKSKERSISKSKAKEQNQNQMVNEGEQKQKNKEQQDGNSFINSQVGQQVSALDQAMLNRLQMLEQKEENQEKEQEKKQITEAQLKKEREEREKEYKKQKEEEQKKMAEKVKQLGLPPPPCQIQNIPSQKTLEQERNIHLLESQQESLLFQQVMLQYNQKKIEDKQQQQVKSLIGDLALKKRESRDRHSQKEKDKEKRKHTSDLEDSDEEIMKMLAAKKKKQQHRKKNSGNLDLLDQDLAEGINQEQPMPPQENLEYEEGMSVPPPPPPMPPSDSENSYKKRSRKEKKVKRGKRDRSYSYDKYRRDRSRSRSKSRSHHQNQRRNKHRNNSKSRSRSKDKDKDRNHKNKKKNLKSKSPERHQRKAEDRKGKKDRKDKKENKKDKRQSKSRSRSRSKSKQKKAKDKEKKTNLLDNYKNEIKHSNKNKEKHKDHNKNNNKNNNNKQEKLSIIQTADDNNNKNNRKYSRKSSDSDQSMELVRESQKIKDFYNSNENSPKKSKKSKKDKKEKEKEKEKEKKLKKDKKDKRKKSRSESVNQQKIMEQLDKEADNIIKMSKPMYDFSKLNSQILQEKKSNKNITDRIKRNNSEKIEQKPEKQKETEEKTDPDIQKSTEQPKKDQNNDDCENNNNIEQQEKQKSKSEERKQQDTISNIDEENSINISKSNSIQKDKDRKISDDLQYLSEEETEDKEKKNDNDNEKSKSPSVQKETVKGQKKNLSISFADNGQRKISIQHPPRKVLSIATRDSVRDSSRTSLIEQIHNKKKQSVDIEEENQAEVAGQEEEDGEVEDGELSEDLNRKSRGGDRDRDRERKSRRKESKSSGNGSGRGRYSYRSETGNGDKYTAFSSLGRISNYLGFGGSNSSNSGRKRDGFGGNRSFYKY